MALDPQVPIIRPLFQCYILPEHLLNGLVVDLNPVLHRTGKIHYLFFPYRVDAHGQFLQPTGFLQQDIHIFFNLFPGRFKIIFSHQGFQTARKAGRGNGRVFEIMKGIIQLLHFLRLHQFPTQKEKNPDLFLPIPFSIVQRVKCHKMGNFATHLKGNKQDRIYPVAPGKPLIVIRHQGAAFHINDQNVKRGHHFVSGVTGIVPEVQ